MSYSCIQVKLAVTYGCTDSLSNKIIFDYINYNRVHIGITELIQLLEYVISSILSCCCLTKNLDHFYLSSQSISQICPTEYLQTRWNTTESQIHVAPQIFSSTFHFHPLSSSFTLFHPLSYLGLFHIMIWNRQCFQTHKPILWDGMEISEREFAKSTVMLIILVPLCGANNCISALVLIGCSLREGSLETHQDHLFHIVLHFHRHHYY